MQETITFLNVLDGKVRRSLTTTPKSQSAKEKLYLKRNTRFPYAKAIDFNEAQYSPFPRWLTEKEGFIDFMYRNYESKLMSIPKICEKDTRASDEKYFVWLYLEQIPFFQDLPPVVKDTILSELRTVYYKPGDCVHAGGPPPFLAVIFVGSVQWRVEKRTVIREKNEVILTDAFQKREHEPVYCKDEAILLTLPVATYQLIVTRLRQEIETK